MRLLPYSIILTILLWVGFTPAFSLSASASPFPEITPALYKLEAHIKEQVQKKRIPGCAVAIVYRNQIVLMNGYGVRTMGKLDPIDVNTLFQLGSVSKPIAATLSALLENKGILKIENPVSHYLPTFALKTKEPPQTFKVKHILSHSSGVPRSGFNNLIESCASYDYIMKVLQKTPIRGKIGKKYDYNNAMFSLISKVTESCTQQSFQKSLSQNLLQPLNMTRTSASFQEMCHSTNRASPHNRDRRGRFIPCPNYSTSYYNVAPAGGINSTIRDMAIFLKAQMGGYPTVINHAVLSRLHQPQIATKSMLQGHSSSSHPIKNTCYGLGFRMVDYGNQKLIFHGGWLKGFTSFIAFIPQEQVGIVVLHNSDSRFSSATALKFFDLYYGHPEPVKSAKKEKKKGKSKKKKGIKS